MFQPGDRFSIYYDDWWHKTNTIVSTNVITGSYRKVLIEVIRIYFDPSHNDFAFVCRRCDTKDNNGCEFVLKLSECQVTM